MHRFSSDIYTKDQYYEAILQLRPKNNEILDFVKNQIKKRKNVFISKEITNKYGVDLYLTSQKFARILGKKLKNSFRGDLKISSKLHSYDRQRSKKIYRVTVCFRLKETNLLG